MAPKKTLSNWLTNRYLLIIRDEENFAEKKTISFNFARIILLLSLFSGLMLFLSIYIVTVTLEQWLDPRYDQRETQRQLMEMAMQIDSVNYEVQLRDQYINNIKRLVQGGEDAYAMIDSQKIAQPSLMIDPSLGEVTNPVDSQFRAEFEKNEIEVLTYRTSFNDEIREMYLFSPIEGVITDGFNPKKDHFGADIVAKEGEPIKCIADGVVIFSSWTLDGGYVIGIQHKGDLISIYKHNSELIKNVGSFVAGGDIIAIIGNTGELTSGPHLHFELWHNGSAVNPQEYVAF